MAIYQIEPLRKLLIQEINLPSSKSESNRALIIQTLAKIQGNGNISIHHLSEAQDTQLMLKQLANQDEWIDVEDAGTTMRFLTAYFAVTNQAKKITGTTRMKERPIGILVEALRTLGAKINYLEKDGFPPLEILEFDQRTPIVSIEANVSSQYISALLLIAPILPMGLTLELIGKPSSLPYIQMTLKQLAYFGIQYQSQGNNIRIEPQAYQNAELTIESDWSAASYWYSIAAVNKDAHIQLNGLLKKSMQGDSIIADWMQNFGVQTTFYSDHVTIKNIEHKIPNELSFDFKACPDLAQTILVCAALKKIPLKIKGIESLRIKETDRIQALQKELQKINCELREESHGLWKLKPDQSNRIYDQPLLFETYNDHRMAMAFATVGSVYQTQIKDYEVVKKSYPAFWKDLQSAGFELYSI
jgi:3-phosphoshikimate 1-carboxyvinyltransferase